MIFIWTQKTHLMRPNTEIEENIISAKEFMSVKVMHRPLMMSNNTLLLVSTGTSLFVKTVSGLWSFHIWMPKQYQVNEAHMEEKHPNKQASTSVLSNYSVISNKPNNQWICVSYDYLRGCVSQLLELLWPLWKKCLYGGLYWFPTVRLTCLK